jgi:hypothetical protein
MTRLGDILTTRDLPATELSALRLDGHVFAVDACFAPVDQVEQPRHRAAALAPLVGPRIIVERASAAWVWGALTSPPARHTLCSCAAARRRGAGPLRGAVREVAISADEVLVLAGVAVTSPLRTVVDLLRVEADFADWRPVCASLMAVGGLTTEALHAELALRPRLPHRRRAEERLDGVSRC